MIRKPLLLTIMVLLSLSSFIGSESVVSAKLPGINSNTQFSSPQEINNFTYLPYIKKDFNWAGLQAWTPWAFQEKSIFGIYADPKPGGVWAVTSENLSYSNNYGLTWKTVEIGNYQPGYLAFNDSYEIGFPMFLASSWGPVLSSMDGITWIADTDFHLANTYLGWIDGYLYLAVNDYPLARIYRRSAIGIWENVGDDLPAQVQDMAMFQSKLYAGTYNGLFRLDENTWIPVPVYEFDLNRTTVIDWAPPIANLSFPSLDSTLQSFPINSILVKNETIYLGTSSPRGVYKSHDGLNWIAIDVGLTGPFSLTVNKLLASKTGMLFAATRNDGVFMSANDGQRWQALDMGLPHTLTSYDVLLDDMGASSLIILRDEPNQQTLAAVFANQGFWLTTVTENTWFRDEPPRVPPKAVLIVGPVDPPDHIGTKSYIAWSDRLADIMEKNGMNVVKVYWPDSTWDNVRAAIGDASIVVYKGHGFSVGEPFADRTEFYGSVNGFTLVNTTDPNGAILGTQDMLVSTNRLAENAVGFFFCCFCAGSSASDSSPIPEAWARWRIEAYSSTLLRMGGKVYFSGVNEEAILKAFFANPDKPLGEIFKSVQGNPEYIYSHLLSPELSIWFDGNSQSGWDQAFAGDPNITPRKVLGR